ncbi:hypothetical protein GCM10022409_02950 [Hymenobacter glaciei]|uniref:Uncharacterized protein n=2 Tax=Hymenobacter glaciei TaxID=877209 RepID=A0ABP7T8E5_9BACT
MLSGPSVVAQQGLRLAFYNRRLDAKDTRPFVVQCLCTPSRDELMPDREGTPDSSGHIRALIRIRPLFAFAKPCNGVYYFQLLSEQWVKPTFRGGYTYYNYLVVLDKQLTVFHSNDPANRAKFLRVRRQLEQNLGASKTDSLKALLLLGYKKVY